MDLGDLIVISTLETRHHNHQASTSKVIAGRHLPIGGTQSHPITETRTRPNMLMMHRRIDSNLFCLNVVLKLNPGKPWSNKTFFNNTIGRGKYHA